MPDERDRDLAAFEKNLLDAVRARAEQRRRQEPQQDRADRGRERARRTDRTDNPLELPERHKAENAKNQENHLRTITSENRRAATRETVDKYYEAWGRALKKAYAARYEMSPRIYERRLAERKTDTRLIPDADKEKMRTEAIREAVTASQLRMNEINEALPEMIDKTINDAAKFTRDRGDSVADTLRQRAAQRDRIRDDDKGRDR